MKECSCNKNVSRFLFILYTKWTKSTWAHGFGVFLSFASTRHRHAYDNEFLANYRPVNLLITFLSLSLSFFLVNTHFFFSSWAKRIVKLLVYYSFSFCGAVFGAKRLCINNRPTRQYWMIWNSHLLEVVSIYFQFIFGNIERENRYRLSSSTIIIILQLYGSLECNF